MEKILIGTVVSLSNYTYTIESPDAPAHLRVQHFVPAQMGKAVVGDTVELAYYSTPSRGFWHVVRVLDKN